MRVLISHDGDDRADARKIMKALASRGIEARFDHLWAACGGNDDASVASIVSHVRTYDYVIPVFSSSFVKRKWMAKELFAALHHEQNIGKRFVVPVWAEDCAVPAEAPSPIDFRDSDAFAENVDRLVEQLTGFGQMFTIMKLGDADLDSTYRLVIKEVAKSFGLEPLRVDEIQDSGPIGAQILRAIERAAIVFADLTGGRQNCYFEAGYAMGLARETILTAKSGTEIHFDLRDRRLMFWDTAEHLKSQLEQRLVAMRDRGLLMRHS